MRYVRVYTGDDGESHFEDIETEISPVDYSDPVAVKQVMFRRSGPGAARGWHNAPRRQFVILLEGQMEVTVGSGAKRLLTPGTFMLAEDLTGHGHVSTTLEGAERVSMIVTLAD